MKKKLIWLYLIFVIHYALSAQDSLKVGRIDGKIIDKETQQAISGATIRIINSKLGAISDKTGNFSIKNVPIGRYSLSASILGYEGQTISDFIVVTKRTNILNFELSPQIFKTDEIIVKPEFFQKEQNGNIISSSTIGYNELRISPGMPDLFKRIQFMPGISRSAESSSALIVRGGDPEENLTLIENIEVASPFHFSSMNGNLVNGSTSIIEPKLVQDVSISSGGFSAKYGDRLSSVSNIKIKEPEKNTLNADLSLDLAGLSAFISSPISNEISFTIAARRGILDLMLKMMDEKFTSRTYDFHTKILYEPTNLHSISFYALYAQDQIKGSQNDDFGEETTYSDLRKSQYSFGINWKYLFADNAYMIFTPYSNNTDWEMEHGKEYNKDAVIDKNLEKTNGLKTEFFYKYDEISKISFGFDIKSISADYFKKSDIDTMANGDIVSAYLIDFSSPKTIKSSAFLEYHISPFEWAKFNLGIRHDYFEYVNKSVFNPRLSASFKINENLNLNLASGLFTQFPQFYKIFMDQSNKALKPAESIHFISGIDYLINEISQIKLELFYKNFNKLAVQLADSAKVLQSSGRGRAYGIELSYIRQMSDNLYLLCNYTYSNSERKDTISDSFYKFKYDRPHSFNLMLTYKLGDWWEFGLTAAYSSGSPYTPMNLNTRRFENGNWYCDKGKRNSERLPDYFRIDCRAERRFVFEEWNLRAYLDLWNLSNNKNIFEYTWNQDFSKKKGQVLFPFMPIIGIAAEI